MCIQQTFEPESLPEKLQKGGPNARENKTKQIDDEM